MKVIFADDGSQFEADNYVDLFTQIRDDCRTPSSSNFEYMKDFARRAVEFENLDVRFTNESDFIRDMERCGLIVII